MAEGLNALTSLSFKRQRKHLPIGQRHTVQYNPIRDTLPVDHELGKIDASHAFYHYLQHRIFYIRFRKVNRPVATIPKNSINEFTIKEYQCIIMRLPYCELAIFMADQFVL